MNLRAGEGYGEDERLPWLETVEDDYHQPRPIGRVLLLVLLALAVIGAAAFGFYRFGQQQDPGGNGALIPAPEGDYKVKPNEPGGLKVEGEGDTVFSTSQGAASNASINIGAMPEAPVEGTTATQSDGNVPGTKSAKLAVPSASRAQPDVPAAQLVRPSTTAGSGSLIQLGAFPNEAGANIAWARLSKRFGYLAPLGKSVERGEKNGEAIFRLRVNAGSNSQARELCGRLKVAGEPCFVAN
jgi:cell division septation protein DedD